MSGVPDRADSSTIPEECSRCCSEYKRGFDEGYENGKVDHLDEQGLDELERAQKQIISLTDTLNRARESKIGTAKKLEKAKEILTPFASTVEYHIESKYLVSRGTSMEHRVCANCSETWPCAFAAVKQVLTEIEQNAP